jgi:hypothetical protein
MAFGPYGQVISHWNPLLPEIATTIAATREDYALESPHRAAPGLWLPLLAEHRGVTEIAGTNSAWRRILGGLVPSLRCWRFRCARAAPRLTIQYRDAGSRPAPLADTANHHYPFNLAGLAAAQHKSQQRCYRRGASRPAALVEHRECAIL